MFSDSMNSFVCPKLRDMDVKCERAEYVAQHPQVKLGQYFMMMHKLHDLCLTCANKYGNR